MTVPPWRAGQEQMPEIGPDVDGVCLVFDRDEVEQLRVGRAASNLLALADDPALARRLTHSVFFVFDGYNDDPRELHSIPQACTFLRSLHASFPWWLHYLAPVPDQWAVLLRCLLAEPGADGQAKPVTWGQASQLVLDMCKPLNVLHAQIGLPADKAKAVFDTSFAAIQETLR